MSSIGHLHVVRMALVVASVTGCSASAFSAHAGGIVEAVWREQHVSFGYRSAGPAHTCAGLRTQLRSLLTLLGVHEAMTITVGGLRGLCHDACREHRTRLARRSDAGQHKRTDVARCD